MAWLVLRYNQCWLLLRLCLSLLFLIKFPNPPSVDDLAPVCLWLVIRGVHLFQEDWMWREPRLTPPPLPHGHPHTPSSAWWLRNPVAESGRAAHPPLLPVPWEVHLPHLNTNPMISWFVLILCIFSVFSIKRSLIVRRPPSGGLSYHYPLCGLYVSMLSPTLPISSYPVSDASVLVFPISVYP